MGNRSVKEQAILDNIIACMEYKKLTQKDLCEYLNVNQQMFTNWKNGYSNSYLKRVHKIAEFLDVSVDHLMGKVVIPLSAYPNPSLYGERYSFKQEDTPYHNGRECPFYSSPE